MTIMTNVLNDRDVSHELQSGQLVKPSADCSNRQLVQMSESFKRK
jgi:hypothetical protein